MLLRKLFKYYIHLIYIFPFKQKDAENYINNYINFVVFYSNESNVTDKFCWDTYIFVKPKNITIINLKDDKIIYLIEKILYIWISEN